MSINGKKIYVVRNLNPHNPYNVCAFSNFKFAYDFVCGEIQHVTSPDTKIDLSYTQSLELIKKNKNVSLSICVMEKEKPSWLLSSNKPIFEIQLFLLNTESQ